MNSLRHEAAYSCRAHLPHPATRYCRIIFICAPQNDDGEGIELLTAGMVVCPENTKNSAIGILFARLSDNMVAEALGSFKLVARCNQGPVGQTGKVEGEKEDGRGNQGHEW